MKHLIKYQCLFDYTSCFLFLKLENSCNFNIRYKKTLKNLHQQVMILKTVLKKIELSKHFYNLKF